MNPDRPSPPRHPVPYARHPPPEEQRAPSMIAQHQPPTLPSIHHLHPELASSSMTHSMASTSTHGPPSYFTSEPMRDYATRHGTDNSDPEGDPPGPPKKKRRRQALSCTECKRRKIKCDRAQPCGPCNRRGEQSKCQWNIIEPMEKYVTRGEYDDLRSRVEYLEDIIARLPNAVYDSRNPPSPALPAHSYRPLAAPRASYSVHSASAHPVHREMPSPYSPVRGEPPPSSNPVHHSTAPESPTYPPSTVPAYPDHGGRSTVSISSSHPPPSNTSRSFSTSPILSSSSRLRETDRAPGSRRASLSLAAITSPYRPEGGGTASVSASQHHQPKNRQAQMPLPLGRHLRKVSVFTGPVTEPLRRTRNITANIPRMSIWQRANYQWVCGSPLERRLQQGRLLVAPPRPHNRRVVARQQPYRLHLRSLR